MDQTPPNPICEQSTTAPASSLTTVERITPISSELTSSKEQCQKLQDSLRKGKLARRKLKVQQLEKTNKCLVNVSVAVCDV